LISHAKILTILAASAAISCSGCGVQSHEVFVAETGNLVSPDMDVDKASAILSKA
jgi:hypothetical protein